MGVDRLGLQHEAAGGKQPPEIVRALAWVSAHTLPVSQMDVAMLRQALDALSLKLDGKQAAAKMFTRKRAVLYNALDYAVEVKALGTNKIVGS